MAEPDTLESWLKVNKINQLLSILKANDIHELCDLTELEESDIDEFIETLNVSPDVSATFKAYILALIQNKETEEKSMAHDVDDSDDECHREAFIDPSNTQRLQPIWNSDNTKADIIKCIGSLRIEYSDSKLSKKVEFCHGTGTVFNIDENNCCQILTAAHNGYQLLRQCSRCNKTTIIRNCDKCQTICKKVIPLDLIKATTVTFSRRCIVKKQTDPNTGEEWQFGDPISSYHVDDYKIHDVMYKKYSSGISGYDICVMTFHCDDKNDAAMYRKICNNIKLHPDSTFGASTTRLHIFGYPGNKGYVDEDSQQMMYQMYGMSTGVHGNKMKVATYSRTNKQYVINSDIDTQAGMSGSAIWSISGKNRSKFLIYATHTGGKQQEKTGVNYGTFLDTDHIKWIERIQSKLLFKPGFNIIPSKKREYILEELKENEYAFKGGNGYKSKSVSIKTTIRNVTSDEKKQYVETKEEKREPEKLFADINHKIILVCGKTGTGKTTLINSMMNYIYNVEIDDPFRLKLIEEEEKDGGQSDSHTDHICSYSIKKPKGGNIDYDLTIIDTPGFGDTRGITKDMQTLEEFKYIFNKILANINGICFIVKATDVRLDATQTYVFNNMLNLWGKDVAENIFILMTFADGGKANCIDALNGNRVLRTCENRLKMNNSAFSSDPTDKKFEDSNKFSQLFWKMGMQCFQDFFDKLNTVETKPIEQSKQVLMKREEIQTKIHHLLEQLDLAFQKQSEIIEKQNIIKSRKEEVNNGTQVFWTEENVSYVKHKVKKWNHYAFSCTEHKRTCHQCYERKGFWITVKQMVYNNVGKTSCIMSNDKGKCKICECHYSTHGCDFVYVKNVETVQRSSWDSDFDEKQKKYDEAKHCLSKEKLILQRFEKESQENGKKTEEKLASITKLQIELEKIALRPQLTTVGKYIDELIDLEKKSIDVDDNKIRMLEELKKQEDYIVDLQNKVSPNVFGL